VRAIRLSVAVGAAALAASLFAAPAWAFDPCGKPGFSYAGIATSRPVHGIRGWLSAPLDPQVRSGDVSGWIGVGRTQTTGKRGILRVGLLASARGSLRLYHERRLRTGQWRRFLGPTVAAGERHKVAIVEMAHRRTFWRVWIDDQAVTNPIHLPRARHGKYAMATGESWDGGTPTCNRLDYFFGPVTVRGRYWHRLSSGQVVEDPGYAVVRRTVGVFNATMATPPGSFTGDWETGNASQWSGNQWNRNVPLSEQFRIVTDPVRQGRYAAKFTVRSGDKFGTTSGERSEVYWTGSDEADGQDYWYSWSTLFPSDWTEPNGWGIFLQFHADFSSTPPPLSFNARADSVVVNVNAGPLSATCCGGTTRLRWTILNSLNKGRWNDFVLHVKWSAGNDGAVTVWHRMEGDNGYVKVLDVGGFPTLQSQNGVPAKNYVKLGLYRDADTDTNTLYQDGFRRWSSADPPPDVAGAV
jgi:hypothetical protein